MNESQTWGPRQRIAVIGSGISGMSAAWLLSAAHDVTVYEKDERLGGHSNTATIDDRSRPVAVDTGFIVYNERNYPNLVRLFDHLGVATRTAEMSFSASLDDGGFEYSGANVAGLFAQRRNLLRPRLWLMVKDVLRFYREARREVLRPGGEDMSLGAYLEQRGYSHAFVHDHLLPMGAAICITPVHKMMEYPLAAFVRFCDNHGLLQLHDRPVWRTVLGGSREYVARLSARYRQNVLLNTAVSAVRRAPDQVVVEDRQGGRRRFDQVVIAAHADQALALLADPDPAERRLLGSFGYQRNLAILHTDRALMPRSRRAWASWNFLSKGRGEEQQVSVSYWMNQLQGLQAEQPLIVTLNPLRQPEPGRVLRSFLYEHPVFDHHAARAQRLLWNLQGTRRTWYCGAYFGHGFHEDGLQAGLAVAEQLGALRRPWHLANPSTRITCHDVNGGVRPRRSRVSASALYLGKVVHQRHRPSRHRLEYRVFSMLLDLDELDALNRRLKLFGHNRRALFSLLDRDHGDGDGTDLRAYVRRRLAEAGIDDAGGPVRLLCYPRVLGHVFNPLSVYYCHRADGSLGAVIYEVNNTHRERHSYVIPVDRQQRGGAVRQACDKRLFVSPFMPMDCRYRFHVKPPGQRLALFIHATHRDAPILDAWFVGRRAELSDAVLLRAALGVPLLTVKVVAAIHWQALKLWRKGLPVFRHTPGPAHGVSLIERNNQP